MHRLAPLDGLVLAVYALALVGIGAWASRRQADGRDYYLAGRRVPAWAAGVSVLATQAGAVSLIGAPAFVALHPQGGLRWLQYELAVPLAMMVLLVGLVPFLHRAGVVSVYEFVERRFDRRARTLVSLTFQVSRALATGVAVYALAIVLSVALDLPLVWTIVAIGGITVAYDVAGGMRAVVATDVAQLGLIAAGIGAAAVALLAQGGGAGALLAGVDPARLRTLDLDGRGDFSFWPMLVGGLFLYVAYYGTDQSQMQRLLSTRDADAARRAVVLNGLLRFPLVLAYVLLGLLLAGFVAREPAFAASLPEGRIDYLVPMFVLQEMPAGVAGLLLAAILAAAMSSLDSALNSLSAATVEDLVRPRLARPLAPRAQLRLARGVTLAWGLAVTLFALGAASFPGGVLEGINRIGSLFFGPILSVFAVGVASRRAPAASASAALLAGLLTNAALWLLAPSVPWLWWNVTGFAAGVAAALALRALWPAAPAASALTWRTERGGVALPGRFGRGWLVLSLFFAGMLALTAALPRLLGA